MTNPTQPIPRLTYTEAEAIGALLHDRWQRLTGHPPQIARDNLAWADIVQCIWRTGSDAVADRTNNP